LQLLASQKGKLSVKHGADPQIWCTCCAQAQHMITDKCVIQCNLTSTIVMSVLALVYCMVIHLELLGKMTGVLTDCFTNIMIDQCSYIHVTIKYTVYT